MSAEYLFEVRGRCQFILGGMNWVQGAASLLGRLFGYKTAQSHPISHRHS